MGKYNVSELIKKTEDQNFEIKGSAPGFKRIAKTLVSFANSEGGILFIGGDSDLKKIIGIEEELNEKVIYEIAQKLIIPALEKYIVEMEVVDDKKVLIIEVEKSDKIHKVKGDNNVYYRNGSLIETKIS